MTWASGLKKKKLSWFRHRIFILKKVLLMMIADLIEMWYVYDELKCCRFISLNHYSLNQYE
jgi:hypothetical protein